MKKKEVKNLMSMIQLMIGISVVSACIIAIFLLLVLYVGTKFGL
tara:strand:+ start:8 stop:139 length:132 start_codon:yes stop_codon:yes gene_type:complete